MSFDEWLKTKPAGTPIRARDAWNASRADSRAEALEGAAKECDLIAEHKRKVAQEWQEEPPAVCGQSVINEQFNQASGAASVSAALAAVIRALAASPKPRGET